MIDNAAPLLLPPLPTQAEGRASYDEANVSRLGLISIQECIPEDYTS
ncbi:hypothetical protein [Deinococcus detaillensis]|nr:hypothetical protein [Deinococcus detaillensis]